MYKNNNSRRNFLKKSTALLAGTGALKSLAAGAQTQTEEDFWQQVRSQFAFTENAVPMNAANLCPAFRAVTDSVEHFTADIDIDCSFNNRAKFSELLEQCRSRIAGQLNVSSDEIALVRNTSEANNMINNATQNGNSHTNRKVGISNANNTIKLVQDLCFGEVLIFNRG